MITENLKTPDDRDYLDGNPGGSQSGQLTDDDNETTDDIDEEEDYDILPSNDSGITADDNADDAEVTQGEDE